MVELFPRSFGEVFGLRVGRKLACTYLYFYFDGIFPFSKTKITTTKLIRRSETVRGMSSKNFPLNFDFAFETLHIYDMFFSGIFSGIFGLFYLVFGFFSGLLWWCPVEGNSSIEIERTLRKL